MFDRSVGKNPVPTIASSRTSTGGSTGTKPACTDVVDREAVEREGEERRIADEVAEARAGESRGALELETPDLRSLLDVVARRRLADAAELDRILLGVAVGDRVVGRVRDLEQSSVPLGLRRGEGVLRLLQLRLDPLERLELLRRRLSLELRAGAQLVDARDELAPARVCGEQPVERVRRRPCGRAPPASRRVRPGLP